MRSRSLVVPLLAGLLAGCATALPPHRPPPQAAIPPPIREATAPPVFEAPITETPLAPPPATPRPILPDHGFSALAGWAQDDHAADFSAFVASCRVARDAATAQVCRRAAALGPLGEADARAFLEANFRPEALIEAGLLTAYYTPIYPARLDPEGEFTAPVRPRPADLPRARAGAPAARYADRSEIENRPAPDALAWMRPEDLFFLQIQGSGVLQFPQGPAMRAVFDGANGAPFVGLAAEMRREGLLADQDTSAERIRAWLADNRGPRAAALMRVDRRYVFFRLEPDDGAEPAGAAGVRLVPGRTVAVDPGRHPMGEVLWLDASAPVLSGAFPTYRRLAMAMDTGSAIKGEARADLYVGRGAEAGVEAGRVRHVLHLYRLAPILDPTS
jgi:membrane-bound lytic murein transglycosylase A